jgi:hypothetical protein
VVTLTLMEKAHGHLAVERRIGGGDTLYIEGQVTPWWGGIPNAQRRARRRTGNVVIPMGHGEARALARALMAELTGVRPEAIEAVFEREFGP